MKRQGTGSRPWPWPNTVGIRCFVETSLTMAKSHPVTPQVQAKWCKKCASIIINLSFHGHRQSCGSGPKGAWSYRWQTPILPVHKCHVMGVLHMRACSRAWMEAECTSMGYKWSYRQRVIHEACTLGQPGSGSIMVLADLPLLTIFNFVKLKLGMIYSQGLSLSHLLRVLQLEGS